MKRREWRKIRAGEGLSDHPMSKQPLDTAVNSVSSEMLQVLRRIIATEAAYNGPVPGSRLRAWGCSTKTVEALVKCAFIDVKWARVPHRAPVDAKVEGATVTERGRAVVAIFDIRAQEAEAGGSWTAPKGVTQVYVASVGGGGGGGGGAGAHVPVAHNGPMTTAQQVAAAINKQTHGVTASVVPVAPGQQYGISISAAKRGPVGRPQKLQNARSAFAAFGRGNPIIVPEGTKVEVVPGKKGA